jgi:hypothetical protein
MLYIECRKLLGSTIMVLVHIMTAVDKKKPSYITCRCQSIKEREKIQYPKLPQKLELSDHHSIDPISWELLYTLIEWSFSGSSNLQFLSKIMFFILD